MQYQQKLHCVYVIQPAYLLFSVEAKTHTGCLILYPILAPEVTGRYFKK